MSSYEHVIIRYRCDHCQVISEDIRDWAIVSVGPCGLTDYYRDEDWCPNCVTEVGDKIHDWGKVRKRS